MKQPLRFPGSASDSTRPSQMPPVRNGSGSVMIWISVGLVVLVVVALGAYLMGRSPVEELSQKVAYTEGQMAELRAPRTLVTPLPTPTAPPACDTFAGEIAALQSLVMKGEFAMVADLTEAHLHHSKLPPCVDARGVLAELGYSAALSDLFASHDLTGRTARLRWEEAEARADANRIPATKRWPPLTVVVQAYNAGFWELPRASFLRAWVNGTVDHHDAKAVRLYFATMRNFGYALASEIDAKDRRQGYVLLRTANDISRAYGLANGEAYQDLVRFVGTAEKDWPSADATDPVLSGAMPKGER